MVLTVGPRDPALLAGFSDSQLSRPFGTLGGIHDLVAQLVVANFVAHLYQRLCDVCLFDFASCRRSGGRLIGRREPQSLGIELEQPGRLCSLSLMKMSSGANFCEISDIQEGEAEAVQYSDQNVKMFQCAESGEWNFCGPQVLGRLFMP